ncbi:MAG: gas vesicle protein GvpO, partial [Streptosporangiaceae bacterium]
PKPDDLDEPAEIEEAEDERNEVGDGRPARRGRLGEERRRPRRRAPSRDATLTAPEAARIGLRQIAELTGKPTEGVAWVEPRDDCGWAVGVEVVEDRRIPSAADILSIYETELDPGGEVLSYRRARRYSRGRGDEGNGGIR